MGSFSVAAVLGPFIHPALFNYGSKTPQGLWPHTCNNSKGGNPPEGTSRTVNNRILLFFFLWLSLCIDLWITAVIHKLFCGVFFLTHSFNSGGGKHLYEIIRCTVVQRGDDIKQTASFRCYSVASSPEGTGSVYFPVSYSRLTDIRL